MQGDWLLPVQATVGHSEPHFSFQQLEFLCTSSSVEHVVRVLVAPPWETLGRSSLEEELCRAFQPETDSSVALRAEISLANPPLLDAEGRGLWLEIRRSGTAEVRRKELRTVAHCSG